MSNRTTPNAANPDDNQKSQADKLIKEAMKLHSALFQKYQSLYPEPVKKPTCRLEFMSPELVEELIAKDTHNRTKRAAHSEYLANEFKAGRYVITNNGVGVSVEDVLTDGGHRLEGLRNAGYPPVYMFVMRNLPVAAQKVVDLGLKRSMADVLTLLLDTRVNEKVVACLHARLKARIDWTRGKWSPDVVLKELEDNMEAIQKISKVKGWADVPAPIRAAVLEAYYANGKDDRVFEWLDKATHGEHIGKGDPAYLFKTWEDQNTHSTGGNNMQIQRYFRASLTITAYLQKRVMSRWQLPVKELDIPSYVIAQQKNKKKPRE